MATDTPQQPRRRRQEPADAVPDGRAGHGRGMVRSAVRLALADPGRAFLPGVAAAAVLFAPDVLRQLPVRRDPSLNRQLLVRALGFTTSAAVQIALIGHLAPLAGLPGGFGQGVPVLRRALAVDPRQVAAGLLTFGALGGALTLPFSLRLFGVRLVTGPVPRPTLRRLAGAELSNGLATAVSAPLFALHVALHVNPPTAESPHRPKRRSLP